MNTILNSLVYFAMYSIHPHESIHSKKFENARFFKFSAKSLKAIFPLPKLLSKFSSTFYI